MKAPVAYAAGIASAAVTPIAIVVVVLAVMGRLSELLDFASRWSARVGCKVPSSNSGVRGVQHNRWAAMYRAWILSVLCVFLSACQLDGPIAEMHLGWGYEYEDLAKLEKIFLLSGFQYEIQDRRSTESAVESVYPWRYKSGGVIYSYFNYSPDGVDRLRAILSLKKNTGRLSVRIGGGDDCPSKGFTTGARKRIEELPSQIKSELGQNVQVKYIDSGRCAA